MGDVGFVEEGLAWEVGIVDEVAVDEAEAAEAGAGEDFGADGAEGAATEDGDAGGEESLLAGDAEAVETELAAVAFELVGREGHGGIIRWGGWRGKIQNAK